METLHDPTHQSATVPAERTVLVVLWIRGEPGRAGEVLPVDGPSELGRAGASLIQQRPGRNLPTGPLTSSHISRRQLLVLPRADDALLVKNLSSAPLSVNGRRLQQRVVLPGDLIAVDRRLLMLCERRRVVLPEGLDDGHAFGGPDVDGLVGESPAAWRIRQRVAFVGRRSAHVLVLGESGTGKELAARAIHRHSQRSGPLVDRNAATIPEGLIDAELFGNIKNYPNPGTPERRGLIGEASQGTLFLDEIGEMPEALQAHLLRVLDTGRYQRLGDARTRTADLRLVAATNRSEADLKHDLAARLRLHLTLPGLSERRADIPLIARHLLRSLARDDAELAALFFEDDEPRLTGALIAALVQHSYTTHVRELEGLLWQVIDYSEQGDLLPPPAIASHEDADASALTPERLQAVLAECGGVKSKAAEVLGLRNRHQLARLLKKHGLD
ncbi:MAG: transcriptional regulator with AAA-type ATPase domain [Myxococcota bacterium]|jgi:transcriptional regulator with AAA-type ATPase domain